MKLSPALATAQAAAISATRTIRFLRGAAIDARAKAAMKPIAHCQTNRMSVGTATITVAPMISA